jgi:hypothetical protein
MYYVLLDSTANLIESFDSRDEALAKLEEIVAADPDAAEDVAMVTYNDDGHPAADDAVTVDASGSSVSARY